MLQLLSLLSSLAWSVPCTAWPRPGAPADPVSADFVLALPTDAPESVRLELPFLARPLHVALARHSLRDRGARAFVVDASGARQEVALAPPRTYRGRVGELPGSVVLAETDGQGTWNAQIHWRGARFRLEHRDAGRYRLRRVGHEHDPLFDCGTESEALTVAGAGAGHDDATPLMRPPDVVCIQRAEIAFDADFEYWQLKGSDVNATIAAIEAHMNQVDYFYARDAGIAYAITGFVVRTAPFYTPTTGGELLDQFRSEWNANQSDISRDLAHLMTAKPGNLIQYGGLAWVGAVCTDIGYGWSLDSAGIIGHEVGHNWGAGHCLDPAPCNNMCGACLVIAPRTRAVIAAHRDSRPCLDDLGPYALPVPPWVGPEGFELSRAAWDTLPPVTIDVLANDDDGNCEPLSIIAFDPLSERGAAISLSAGSGPAGRDQLVYTPPSALFVGEDRFTHTVGDGAGGATDGRVTVQVLPRELRGLWRLDEGTGLDAQDATPDGRNGIVQGGAQWTSGVFATALELDGASGHVELPPLELGRDELTITAWIRRNGPQNDWAGLVFSRSGSTTAGLHFGTADELRYTWNGFHWNFDSGLHVPDQTWTFVALVVRPERAELALAAGAPLQTATNVAAHELEEFDGPASIGRDPGSAARFFRGAVDDVRIYGYALSPAELDDVAAGRGRAAAPSPRDGARWAEPDFGMTWVPDSAASAHEVYLGANYFDVRDGTTSSPVFQGSLGTPLFQPPPLAAGQTLYWRVDEVGTNGLTQGDVWVFAPSVAGHWTLDEGAGSTAIDAKGLRDGSFVGDVLLGQPSASAVLASSVYLDGAADFVEIPALGLATDRATFSAWIRRTGTQSPWSGLVFSRAGNSVAGLNLGEAHELRYHWNGASSTWGFDSGLVVPDDTWVFTALVVEPGQATLWLGQNGVLSSATNSVNHAVEEFDGVLRLGRDRSGRDFRGWIDDARLYDTAMSDTEIRTLYESTR